jgi:purine nucleosidase
VSIIGSGPKIGAMSAAPRPVLFDTDPGIDDAMALAMLLNSPEIDLIGCTTVFGNAHTTTTTQNALALLQIGGRTDVPVVAGAHAPVASNYHGPVPHIHGHNGQGNAELPTLTHGPLDESASDFIYRMAQKHRGELVLLPVGPLTNIAIALSDHPDLVDLVSEVIVMGGNALCGGNATPTAEANIFNDAEAADIVFGGSWKITMVGLDVTQQMLMTEEMINRFAQHPTELGRHLGRILPIYQTFTEQGSGHRGVFLHDPGAVAFLLAPELFTTKAWPIRVETQGISRGKTWPNVGAADTDDHDQFPDRESELVDHRAPWRNRPLVNVCTEVDGPAAVSLIATRLGVA